MTNIAIECVLYVRGGSIGACLLSTFLLFKTEYISYLMTILMDLFHWFCGLCFCT